ncbi:MAG: 3-dehydroquinate synthase [Arsenophonus sp.]|nr:MAG: 3-dehydroquinate synthase [Arsenophonus sp.]
MHIVNVNLLNRTYPIIIGKDLLNSEKIFSIISQLESVMIITNSVIGSIYLDSVYSSIFKVGIRRIDNIVISDGEKYKNLNTFSEIISILLKKKYSRNTVLIALGGGVIGDITGFVASCYKRGVPYIQIPTTLLSQIDSSIGGKTGVNHLFQKNMVGSIYQPILVINDFNTLNTLPKKQYLSGLAEVIKYAISLDYNFFCWLEKNIKKILILKKKELTNCIKKCCILKSNIITLDENEMKNQRILLNLGHTFGHVIESALKNEDILHGEAVSIGIVIASRISLLLKKINLIEFQRIVKLLNSSKLPTKIPKILSNINFISYLKQDKKMYYNQYNMVLLKSIGSAELYLNLDKKIILKAIHLSF